MLERNFLILWDDDFGDICVRYLTRNATLPNHHDGFKGIISNNRLHGKVIYMFLNNYHVITYAYGNIHGCWKTYDHRPNNTILKSVMHYKNDMRHGKEIIFNHNNGRPQIVTIWRNGSRYLFFSI